MMGCGRLRARGPPPLPYSTGTPDPPTTHTHTRRGTHRSMPAELLLFRRHPVGGCKGMWEPLAGDNHVSQVRTE